MHKERVIHICCNTLEQSDCLYDMTKHGKLERQCFSGVLIEPSVYIIFIYYLYASASVFYMQCHVGNAWY